MHWIIIDYGRDYKTYQCSKCGEIFDTRTNNRIIIAHRCPNCDSPVNPDHEEYYYGGDTIGRF